MKKDYLLYPAGNRLKIVCTAEGRPAPAITWLKDNKKLKYLPDGVTPLTNITFDITFNSLKPKQAGKYKCVVSNKAGLIDMTYTIKVKRNPLYYFYSFILFLCYFAFSLTSFVPFILTESER